MLEPAPYEPRFVSSYLARLVILRDAGNFGVLAHMLPLLERLAEEYWLTDEEQAFIDSLKV